MTIRKRWHHFRQVPERFPGLTLSASLRNQLLWEGECGFCTVMVERLNAFARIR